MSNVKSNRAYDPVIDPVRDMGAPLEQYGGRGLFGRLLNLSQPKTLGPELPAVPDTLRVPRKRGTR